jgi:hypothetical protein
MDLGAWRQLNCMVDRVLCAGPSGPGAQGGGPLTGMDYAKWLIAHAAGNLALQIQDLNPSVDPWMHRLDYTHSVVYKERKIFVKLSVLSGGTGFVLYMTRGYVHGKMQKTIEYKFGNNNVALVRDLLELALWR